MRKFLLIFFLTNVMPLAAQKHETASKNVHVLSENFNVPQLATARKIWIYLPENYAETNERFPVIYMEDGQNLFSEAKSFAGEWKVDETLDAIAKSGGPEAIVVGIENGGEQRLNEYSPWKNQKYGGGRGDLYADFLAETLKPFIDENYRTRRQAKYSVLMGSSMGGLISFYTGLKYPEKFGKMALLSPSFWFAKDELKFFINRNSRKFRNSRFYFAAGQKESPEMVSDIREIIQILLNKGVPQRNISSKFDENGTHSEAYWSQEFGNAYRWLLK